MEQHILSIVYAALGVFGTGFIGYVSHAIVRFIVSKHLQSLAPQAVRYAEDAFKMAKGEEKLNHACDWVAKLINTSKLLKFLHITVTKDEIEGFVRAAFNLLEADLKKELKQA